MENYTGNTVAHGGAPEDEQEYLMCPKCRSEDVFNTKDDIGLCRECWYKDEWREFWADKYEYNTVDDYLKID